MFDTDQNGFIDLHEFKILIGAAKNEREKNLAEEIFHEYDKDKNGLIDFNEFRNLIFELLRKFESHVEILTRNKN